MNPYIIYLLVDFSIICWAVMYFLLSFIGINMSGFLMPSKMILYVYIVIPIIFYLVHKVQKIAINPPYRFLFYFIYGINFLLIDKIPLLFKGILVVYLFVVMTFIMEDIRQVKRIRD